MEHYLLEWANIYMMHFCALVAFGLSVTVYVRGLPKISEILTMLKSAIVMASVIAIFSSFSHAHYLSHFGKLLK